MTLRNAFAGLVTESVTGAIEAILSRIEAKQAATADAQAAAAAAQQATSDTSAARADYTALMGIPRDLPYAKDLNDRMRVTVDNQPALTLYVADSSSSLNQAVSAPLWFNPTAIFMVDEREQTRVQSEINFNTVRTNRWVFS